MTSAGRTNALWKSLLMSFRFDTPKDGYYTLWPLKTKDNGESHSTI